MMDLLQKIKRHLDPAYAFVMGYLQLFAESAHVGALAVWFDDPETQVSSLGMTPGDVLGQQLAHIVFGADVGPEGNSRFCTLLREQPAADERCTKCDKHWMARTKRTRKPSIYQCHAGLTEVVVPILVHGKSIGEIMAGQLTQPSQLPRGFADVWDRIRTIRGLNKRVLGAAFDELHVAADAEVKRLAANIETVAQTLGALLENVSELVVEERQLTHMRSYQERDFVESVLNIAGIPEEDAVARAHTLGIDEPPTVVIVAHIDLTDQTTFDMNVYQAHDVFARLLETAHYVLRDVPGVLVSSIRPGEVVILLRPQQTRNPELKNLRLRELAQKLKTEMETRVAAPILVGVGNDHGTMRGMAKSYREARAAADRALQPAMAAGSGENSLERTARDFMGVLDALGSAARNPDEQELQQVLANGLRLIAACPDYAHEMQRLLFSQMITNLITTLRAQDFDADTASEVLSELVLSYPTLRSMDNILEWFHTHVGKLRIDKPCSPHEQVVARACAIVADHIHETVDRNEVARMLGMSTTYFGKMFRRQMGLTFRDYVQRLRVASAQRLLLDPQKSVAQVAVEVGYSSTAALSRAFDQVCGASPIIYRARPRDFKRIDVPMPRAE